MAPRRPTDSVPTQPRRYRASTSWPPDDDAQLLKARAKRMTWNAIADQYFPDKGHNACRKHHERLVKRQNEETWDQEMLHDLSSAYWQRRKEIWEPLAEAMNQKWQFVEEKCLELGLSRLRLAANRANDQPRRVSGTDDDFSDEADSGVAMEDETEMENLGRRSATGPTAGVSKPGRSIHGGQTFRQPAPPINTALTPVHQTTQSRYGHNPSHSIAGTQAFSPVDPARTLPSPTSTRPAPRQRSERHSIQSLLSPAPDS